MRRLGLATAVLLAGAQCAVCLSGCALQRAETASKAQADMVGMPKADVLACMGVPNASATQGDTEVWSYVSGDGRTVAFSTTSALTTGQSTSFGQAAVLGHVASYSGQSFGSASTSAFGLSVAHRFSCTINVVFKGGRVSRVNYSGPTGPLLAPGEQCAYAVQNCVH